jgi:hypothetical protein
MQFDRLDTGLAESQFTLSFVMGRYDEEMSVIRA